MKSARSYRATVLLHVTVSGVVFLSVGRVNADFAFGPPTNLGPPVNTAYGEVGPSISSDGLDLYFSDYDSEGRPGGYGGADLWVATRTTTNDQWLTPTNLGPGVNSPAHDMEPSISADGLSLYFNSDRPGGYGGFDIWVVRRATIDSTWGTPENLGPAVNSAASETEPCISADGLTLFFDSDRKGGFGDSDLYMTTRPTMDGNWDQPVNLGATVNSSSLERGASVSSDGLVLFFVSYRSSEHSDLWMTTRATVFEPWTKPVSLPLGVNSPACEATANISADSLTLFYKSDRPGGLGGHDIWQASISAVVDLVDDEIVDLKDFSKLAQRWQGSEPSVDIGPSPFGDGVVDFRDLAVLTAHWLADASPPVYIQWLGHASVKIWAEDIVVYVDPRNLPDTPHDATIVCVTHSHSDHYAPADIGKVWKADTIFVGPPDVVAAYGRGQVLAPDQILTWPHLSITGVPAYNINKTNHPKANNWLGFIVEIASKRVYVAGDTDLTPEMKALQGIDVAILPAGGSYTMDAIEAAEATQYLQPQLAIPYHWGEIVGTLKDAQQFARLAACNVKIMTKGEILSSRDWGKDFSLVAHWPLDEREGEVATDIAGLATGTLHGAALWRLADGMVGGALQLDGLESYISTPSVLDPADGAFSAFAWVKGGAPGQVIVSQTDGADWLMADPSAGRLMTTLQKPRGRTPVPPLVCDVVITDGQWHRLGLVWDGSDRILYVDDLEAARDTQAAPASSTGGLYIGCGKDLEAGTFFSGLIDDVRVYNRAVKP